MTSQLVALPGEAINELLTRQAGLFHDRTESSRRDRVSPENDHASFLALPTQHEASHMESSPLMDRFDDPDLLPEPSNPQHRYNRRQYHVVVTSMVIDSLSCARSRTRTRGACRNPQWRSAGTGHRI